MCAAAGGRVTLPPSPHGPGAPLAVLLLLVVLAALVATAFLTSGCSSSWDWKWSDEWNVAGRGIVRPSVVPLANPHLPAEQCRLPGVDWWVHKLQPSAVLPGQWACGISKLPPDYPAVDSGDDWEHDQSSFYWASARTMRVPLPCPPDVRGIYVNMDGLDFDLYDDMYVVFRAVGVDAVGPWADVVVHVK